MDLNVTQSILGAALADNVEALFHLPGYLTHPERERKTDVLLRIDNATVYAIKKRMFTWLYLFDERQLGASRNIAVLAVVCGGSSSSSSYSGAYNADARGSLAASDCAHVPAIFSEVKLGVGHMVVVVVGDTRGDREWLDVFVELEKAFPARFTAYHRVGSSCTSAWNLIARLAFIRMRPRSDRVMIVTPTFRPMRDVLARFAAYGRWKNAHLARLMEPPAPPETPETQGGKSRPSSCFCNALLLTREGYARNGGFAEDVHADCAAAEADFFHVAASSGAAGAAVEFIRVASSAAVPANAIRPVFGRSGANPRNMARSESIGEAPMTAEQLEQFCACSK